MAARSAQTTSGPDRQSVAKGKPRRKEPLSYFPLVIGNLLLVTTPNQIRAYNVETGKPAWGSDPIIYQDEDSSLERRVGVPGYGTPRYTMTAYGNKLYARLGNPVTSSQTEQAGFVHRISGLPGSGGRRQACLASRRPKTSGPMRVRRWPTVATCTLACAAATSVRRRMWPVSTPKPESSSGAALFPAPDAGSRHVRRGHQQPADAGRGRAVLQREPGSGGGLGRARRSHPLADLLPAGNQVGRNEQPGNALQPRSDSLRL